MKQRKHYTAEQKLMILQELLENNVPISQLAEKYEAHPNDIYNLKNKLFESAIDIFTSKISSQKQTSIEQKEIEKLQAEVDKRIIINDDDCYVFFSCWVIYGAIKLQPDWYIIICNFVGDIGYLLILF